MRITNTTIARNYTSNLNRNLKLLNDANVKVSSQRKFDAMSENTADGVRAMTVRRSIARLEGYLDNAKTTQNTFSGAEKNLLKISDLTKDISDKYILAINGSNGKDERDIIKKELTSLRDEILACANSQYSDRYLFGGTNTESMPFTTRTEAGSDLPVLYYNGVKVMDIEKGNPDYAYLFDDAAYVDVGLGFQMLPAPDSQNVTPNSAFKNTLVGLDFIGTGKENIYNVINEMITSLESGFSFDAAEGGKLLNRFKDAADNVGVQLTKLGADSSYLDFTVSRIESENDKLIEQQSHLEFVDPAEAIMDFKMQEYIYNTALQMGSRLLQPSLFNFIS